MELGSESEVRRSYIIAFVTHTCIHAKRYFFAVELTHCTLIDLRLKAMHFNTSISKEGWNVLTDCIVHNISHLLSAVHASITSCPISIGEAKRMSTNRKNTSQNPSDELEVSVCIPFTRRKQARFSIACRSMAPPLAISYNFENVCPSL